MSLLEVNDLSVRYHGEQDLLAVDKVSFEISEGETLGIVGESGSGKSTVAKSVLRRLDENGEIANGKILYRGEDISEYTKGELNNNIRWKEISYIPQNAMNALDPVYRIGTQFTEIIQYHTDKSKKEAKENTREMLRKVDIDPNRMNDYPHELSGGQRQRVVIALSLVLEPSLVICDEPTTGLDVIIQNNIINLLNGLSNEIGNSLMLITHDMGVVNKLSDGIGVMYGGRLMEYGPTQEVFQTPSHPYTMGLKKSFPTLDGGKDIISIPGDPVDLRNPPIGCRFKHRCPFATERCDQEPPYITVKNGDYPHNSKCHYAENAEDLRAQSEEGSIWEQ